MAQFHAATDQEYLDKFFIPGLRKAGDFRAAAVLDTQDKLLLHNAGPEFPAQWVHESARAGESKAEVRAVSASEAELVEWLIPASPRPGR